MTAPPPYPRTPYLWPTPHATRDDRVLSRDEAGHWLREPVTVEEKLDGANVSLWLDPMTGPQVASRGGPDAMDRAGQLGRLRAWAGERLDAVAELLADGWAAYGEWLWLRHGAARRTTLCPTGSSSSTSGTWSRASRRCRFGTTAPVRSG